MEPVSLVLNPSDNTFYLCMTYENCTLGKTPFLKTPTNNYPTSCNSTSEQSITFKKIIPTSFGYYGLDLNKKLFKIHLLEGTLTSPFKNGKVSRKSLDPKNE